MVLPYKSFIDAPKLAKIGSRMVETHHFIELLLRKASAGATQGLRRSIHLGNNGPERDLLNVTMLRMSSL